MDLEFLSSSPKRLLIVDDELSVREVLAEGMSAFGYETAMAGSASEAFDLLRREQFHLVLSDIEMPGENGLALMKRTKAEDGDLDFVMVTGVIDASTAINSIRQGASDYVTKPFNLEEVQIVVERTIEKRRLILENRAHQKHLEVLVAQRTQQVLEKKQEVERLYEDLQESYESTLQALVTALDFRDNETQGHSHRVVEYAVQVATKLNIVEPELSWIRRGAILHDVGKIGISDAILRKPGKLDPEEWEEMRRHPELGYRMLKRIRFLEPALDIVYCHQERYDGSGYPRQLKGEDIPLGARIFSVVDTFDAMTSDRPYRAALSIAEARDEIKTWSGRQFDPKVADAFLSIDAETWLEIRERIHEKVSATKGQVTPVMP
jgi:response regulator RpfG family c-di-GMP phosphodiesterase